jgi:hypothetical protein
MNNIIQDEIQIHGNTNRITDAQLPSGAQIFAIGDSHSIFFYNSMKIKEHWFFGSSEYSDNLPLTIYKFISSSNLLDIYNIGNMLSNGHETYNIKERDYVLFFFGFNDIQKNITKYSENNYKQGILDLFTTYIQRIIQIQEKYKINTIIPCIYPNPRPNAVGVNCNGTYEERREYAEYANIILKDLCFKNNLPFLDIYSIISDNDGFIRAELTIDNIHLDYNNQEIRDIIEAEILKFCM